MLGHTQASHSSAKLARHSLFHVCSEYWATDPPCGRGRSARAGWLVKRPGEQLHPLRWTSISKGQVWCAPPKEEARRGANG